VCLAKVLNLCSADKTGEFLRLGVLKFEFRPAGNTLPSCGGLGGGGVPAGARRAKRHLEEFAMQMVQLPYFDVNR